jgi:hypothetical protein
MGQRLIEIIAGWLELKVEEIAASEARRFKNCKTVVDAFGGYGGNSIQLALVVDKGRTESILINND